MISNHWIKMGQTSMFMVAAASGLFLDGVHAFRILSKAPGNNKDLAMKDIVMKYQESADSGSAPQDLATNLDLQSIVRPEVALHEGVYKDALNILSTIQSSPSCYRMATSNLLESCHSIDGSKRDSEGQTDDLKSIYAARAAICEITEAGALKPEACEKFSRLDFQNLAKSLRNSKKQINACLQALEARPQWWTSYSNSRQNAVTLCKAVRADIERDELIDLHRKMVETQARTDVVLSKTARMASERLASLQQDFNDAKQIFQDQFVKDVEITTNRATSSIDKLTESLATVIQGSISKVKAAFDASESRIEKIAQNIDHANNAAIETAENVDGILKNAIKDSAELAHVQKTQWEDSRTIAGSLMTSLGYVQDSQIGSLAKVITNMGIQLDTSNNLLARMSDSQNSIEEQMSHLSTSLSSLETKAEALGAAQHQHAESQARLHQQLEVDMQVAQGHLSDVVDKATQLQATVSDTSAKIQSMTGFAKVFGTFFDWALIFVAVAALMLVCWALRAIWRFNRWAGIILLALTGLMVIRDLTSFLTRSALGNMLMPRSLPSYMPNLHHPFSAALLFFVMCMGIAYHFAGRFGSEKSLERSWSFHVPDLPFYSAFRMATQ